MKRVKDTLIKILSLGIGLAIGIVLIAKVCFELSYDSFYKDVDRIYLIKAEWAMGDRQGDGERITASWWYAIDAAAIVLAIVGLVIGICSWRIAQTNPVIALKKE